MSGCMVKACARPGFATFKVLGKEHWLCGTCLKRWGQSSYRKLGAQAKAAKQPAAAAAYLLRWAENGPNGVL